MGGLVEKVIPRNTAIPTAMAQDFTTFKDGQTAMAIHVVQGEREVVDKCRSLAKFELRGIPPMAAGAARIRVTAREMTTGVESSIMVKPSYGLSDEDVIRMLQEGNRAAEEDMHERELREQKVEALRIIESTNSALAADADLLSQEERKVVDDALSHLNTVREGTDTEAIKQAIDAVAKSTEEFAARRMDRSIRLALEGKSVDDVLGQ